MQRFSGAKAYRWLVLFAAVAAGGAGCERPPDEWSVKVIQAFPHDPEAFTQGLTIADGEMYEGTGIRGQSSIRRVDIETGTVEQINRLNRDLFGEGIAVIGDKLYQLTWQSQRGIVYDRDTFTVLKTFTYRSEGWGLTYDGHQLIMSDGTKTIRFLDPESFEVVRAIDVHTAEGPVDNLNELEYIDGEIWSNIWYQDRIARIAPEDGRVLGWIDASKVYPQAERDHEAVLNGIAYDASSGKIYITGKDWPRLYEVEIVKP